MPIIIDVAYTDPPGDGGSSVPIDPEAAIDDWAARAEGQSALATKLSERLQQAQASAESRNGEVVVTVNHSGGLVKLRLSDQAMTLSASDLEETILATSHRAQANLARQVSDLVSSLYGAGSETADFVGGTYAEQFPEFEDQNDDGERR
jgi:DNA-binding protein YbaB